MLSQIKIHMSLSMKVIKKKFIFETKKKNNNNYAAPKKNITFVVSEKKLHQYQLFSIGFYSLVKKFGIRFSTGLAAILCNKILVKIKKSNYK